MNTSGLSHPKVDAMKILRRLWRDQRGSTLLAANLLLYSVLVLGVIVGLVTLRDQLVQEFGDLAVALESLDQLFHVDGAGFTDSSPLNDPAGEEPAGLSVREAPAGEGSD